MQSDYDKAVKRLADIMDMTERDMRTYIAVNANRMKVRPITYAKQRISEYQRWSVQRIVNSECRDGAGLRSLPHDACRTFARAMREAARKGGHVREHYRRLVKAENKDWIAEREEVVNG